MLPEFSMVASRVVHMMQMREKSWSDCQTIRICPCPSRDRPDCGDRAGRAQSAAGTNGRCGDPRPCRCLDGRVRGRTDPLCTEIARVLNDDSKMRGAACGNAGTNRKQLTICFIPSELMLRLSTAICSVSITARFRRSVVASFRPSPCFHRSFTSSSARDRFALRSRLQVNQL